MNNYRYREKPGFQNYGTKAQQRIMFALVILLTIALVVVSILYVNSIVYKNKATEQFERRLRSNLLDATGQVSRMAGGVQSNTASRLGLIRQHIYAMDQINLMSITISGEGGRLIPQEAISALYDDLDRYELIVQTATGNPLEVRTTLLTHLTALQEIIDR